LVAIPINARESKLAILMVPDEVNFDWLKQVGPGEGSVTLKLVGHL